MHVTEECMTHAMASINNWSWLGHDSTYCTTLYRCGDKTHTCPVNHIMWWMRSSTAMAAVVALGIIQVIILNEIVLVYIYTHADKQVLCVLYMYVYTVTHVIVCYIN